MPADPFYDVTRRDWESEIPETPNADGKPWRDPVSGAIRAGDDDTEPIATRGWVQDQTTDQVIDGGNF